MQPPDEHGWVLAAQTGDRAAYAVLVSRYWERIRRWVYTLIRDSHAAEDVTQAVFLKAWQRLGELQSPLHFRAWLFRIARNAALDSRLSASRSPFRPIAGEPVSPRSGPNVLAGERELKTRIDEACQRMPAKYRDAFLLWVEESMPYAEIAIALQTTAITARWRVCKAREYLRRALKPYMEFEQL